MMTRSFSFGAATVAVASLFTACTVETVPPSNDATTSGAGGSNATATVASTSTGGELPMGPPSSAQSLAAQQSEHGWSAASCPATPQGVTPGYGIGDQLGELTLYDCEGNPVALDAICGADAAWLFFAHGWCPHCKLGSEKAEGIHDSFEGQNLATINVLVETASGGAPDAVACQAWRDVYGHEDVITLYDPTGLSSKLWEQNYTALSVFLDRDRVILTKQHTDSEVALKNNIQQALP